MSENMVVELSTDDLAAVQGGVAPFVIGGMALIEGGLWVGSCFAAGYWVGKKIWG